MSIKQLQGCILPGDWRFLVIIVIADTSLLLGFPAVLLQ
jgi:hypothetical protein